MRQGPRAPERAHIEVLFRNAEQFREKVERIKSAGLKGLHIIADFDRTLTKGSTETGQHQNTTPGMFDIPGLVSDAIREGKQKLFLKYRPIEMDPTLPLSQKIPHMIQWLKDSETLYREHGLTYAQIRSIAQAGLLVPRDGLTELCSYTHEKNVPFLIFSAGIGDMIEEYFKAQHIDYPNIHLIANRFEFDSEGRVLRWKGEILTSATKNESHIAFETSRRDIQRRPNVLLLGDHEGDIHMADGAKHDTILSVGFLNGERNNLEQHLATFDAVIPEDVGLDFPTEILKEIDAGR